MKKLMTMAVLSFCMTIGVSGTQPINKEDQQIEKQIKKLIRRMTLEEKVSLLHGNSKFYVSEIKRLDIPECSVMRPAKELKGFRKFFLKAGESKQVEIDIPVSSLAFYSEAQKQFVVEPGTFVLHLATSAENIKSDMSIEIK